MILRVETYHGIVAPSALSVGDGWQLPEMLTEEQICELIDDYILAARRSVSAGYKMIEIHGAHGYLIHSFLSPISNHRTDKYGSDLSGRMRIAIEVSDAIRRSIPDETPLFFKSLRQTTLKTAGLFNIL